ncbi:hypothetical protein [Pedobacter hiemivivus]|uniref:hypothetical protein n=1 Tax=Pedobacter hiemivivus TaxID=2530454 RepID=UPI00146A15F1|nr:hypothetical protein [Pedobacter hiemivivus]
MSSIVKKIPGSKYTAEERFTLSAQSPFFLKKKKDAEAFLKKAGLPERFKKTK